MTARRVLVFGCLCLLCVGCTTTGPRTPVPPTVDVSGVWEGTYAHSMRMMGVRSTDSSYMTLVLKQSGSNLTGTINLEGGGELRPYQASISGTVNGDWVAFTILNDIRILLHAEKDEQLLGGDDMQAGIAMSLRRGRRPP